MRRPAVWIAFTLVSLASAVLAVRYFPRAFSIVALDITMDREQALARARELMTRDQLGPPDYRQAASFTLDGETQTFVELEGGGKEAFTAMLRSGLYSAYTWQVRQFKEGETHETTIRFTPAGTPYGFVEKLAEDAPGAALDPAAARAIAERGAARWSLDLSPFTVAEQGQERRVGGRVDHTITYERTGAAAGEGRYRLRLVVSGDRLTELTHFVRIPEAFTRRYANMRSANEAIGIGSVVGLMLLYVVGGIGVGLFFMMRLRWVQWRHAAFWGMAVGVVPGAEPDQRVPAGLDGVRHRDSAIDVPRAAGGDGDRQFHRLLGVLRRVVHRRGDADPPRLRASSAALARLVAASAGRRSSGGPRRLGAGARPHRRRIPAGVGVPRL